ncbi:MAG: transglycosylase SLT domain-containing protein [Sulfurovum sp.]|nr:transglycosylase SLT domain-containing protein [Sulfurovum sp.]
MRAFMTLMVCVLLSHAADISQRYPSGTYVLDEFDITPSYVHNPDFNAFVMRHEKHMYRLYRYATKRNSELVKLLRQKLLEDDLSDLFLYLSIVESALRTNAVSSKKAAGLWQFMPKTARDYKLEIYDCIDQRCDPVSATDAAIQHLRRLHERFGKWYLAILAYNCGEGRLSRAIEKAGTDALEVLIDPQNRYLPKETIDYIRKIVLVAMIGESENILFPLGNEENGLVKVEVRGGTSLAEIASLIDLPLKKLQELNPAYIKAVIPEEKENYPLLIPEEKMAVFYLKYFPEEKEVIVKPYLLSHHVRLGETLESIAKKYGSTEKEIRYVNHMNDLFLEVNTTLFVPVNKEMFEKVLFK